MTQSQLAIEIAKSRTEIASLQRDISAIKSAPKRNPLPYPGGRPCFHCSAPGMCPHREPEVVAAEYARMAIGLGDVGRSFE